MNTIALVDSRLYRYFGVPPDTVLVGARIDKNRVRMTVRTDNTFPAEDMMGPPLTHKAMCHGSLCVGARAKCS